MKAIHWTVAAAAFAFVQPAQAGINDPEVIIYRFPGIRDTGADVATVFHCTNFSGVLENVRFVIRRHDTTIATNLVQPINHLQNLTVATHPVNAYNNVGGPTGPLTQGTAAIAATSTNIVCSAMTIDAVASLPTGVVLPGIRFNPVPGSQE